MTGNEIRKQFLEFFQKHNHQKVRSSSLIPADDPTLLFTNAGMVQFKRVFLGEEKRDYLRAATSQKCVRAGGKHNDLENVGYTARHHTFFEMLGNFSFGDYFKEKAVEYAWDLITNIYKLPADKLFISIYKQDDEAFEIWNKNIGVPEKRIVRLGEKDNFWAMGDTGPCGPCSEIHIDRGEEFGCKKPDCATGCDCDRFLEIWNLVFMQFNRDKSGKLTPLPKPSIDTGMGLERIASVIQQVNTNYDTDLIMPVIKNAEELSGIKIGENAQADVAMKVIADHGRAAAFLIGDGILPSNEGRGYVLRRIIRRAIRYGRNIGLIKPFLHKTSKTVLNIMEPAYPELLKAEDFIAKVISSEEIRFSETLDKGLKLLTDTLFEMKEKKEEIIPGDVVFKLYDTYGFPVDIIKDVVRDTNISLDIDGFEFKMEAQKKSSKTVVSFSQTGEAYKKLSAKGIKTEFVGYNTVSASSEILSLVKDGKELKSAFPNEEIEIIAKTTPFYAESGGQAGDSGVITDKDEKFKIDIKDTVKDPAGLIIHKGIVTKGAVEKGIKAVFSVNETARQKTCANHTATHILHYALRKVLGNHVKQAGSYVGPARFRFDFTHFSQAERKQIEKIELIVNEKIIENFSVGIEEMDAASAFKTGATALFEEKYGDIVRVVSIDSFSKELCGGTHIKNTGTIGLFKIISETSIASGVRRIFAVTGKEALLHVQKTEKILFNAANLLKDKPENLFKRIQNLLDIQKNYEKENKKLKNLIAVKSAETSMDDFVEINGIKIIAKKAEAENPGELREIADRFKDKIKTGIVILASVSKTNNKVMLVAVVTKDITDRFSADKIVKEIAAIVGGGGGGRPDMAQAGGSKPEKIEEALNAVLSGKLASLN
ncbi:MAG: alanine--tRNA ligase [Deltaproteobacteria bacterium]|nr:alanine--tRNA ligase [Deltaproteobacteria bacterium]